MVDMKKILADKKKKKKKILKPRKCKFCANESKLIDYKDIGRMKKYLTERGKIIARRITGNCSKHQRQLANAVKNARIMALIPFINE